MDVIVVTPAYNCAFLVDLLKLYHVALLVRESQCPEEKGKQMPGLLLAATQNQKRRLIFPQCAFMLKVQWPRTLGSNSLIHPNLYHPWPPNIPFYLHRENHTPSFKFSKCRAQRFLYANVCTQ